MLPFDGPELASGEVPGSGEDGPSSDTSPVITVCLVLIALAVCTIVLSYYLWRRRRSRTLLSGGSVALLDNRVRGTTTAPVEEGLHAFETPRFVMFPDEFWIRDLFGASCNCASLSKKSRRYWFLKMIIMDR